MPKVLILMATYNGERFIGEQLESIAAQTHREWELWVRDDGSSDATLSVVRDFAGRHPGRVRVIEDDEKHLGPCRNFARLMELALRESDAEYFALSDQDDVWREDKLEVQLDAIRGLLEDRPALVFSDLEVVDEALRVLHASFWKMARYDPVRGVRIPALLSRNVVTGCTILMNRLLLKQALPVPQEAPIHDWWLALVASVFGSIVHVPRALVQYRQHGSNAIGARSSGALLCGALVYFLHPLDRLGEVRRIHRMHAAQARALLKAIPLNHEAHSKVQRFVRARSGGLASRIRYAGLFLGLGLRGIPRILIP